MGALKAGASPPLRNLGHVTRCPLSRLSRPRLEQQTQQQGTRTPCFLGTQPRAGRRPSPAIITGPGPQTACHLPGPPPTKILASQPPGRLVHPINSANAYHMRRSSADRAHPALRAPKAQNQQKTLPLEDPPLGDPCSRGPSSCRDPPPRRPSLVDPPPGRPPPQWMTLPLGGDPTPRGRPSP